MHAVPPAVSVPADGVKRIDEPRPEPRRAFLGVPSVNTESGAAVPKAKPQYWLAMPQVPRAMVPDVYEALNQSGTAFLVELVFHSPNVTAVPVEIGNAVPAAAVEPMKTLPAATSG